MRNLLFSIAVSAFFTPCTFACDDGHDGNKDGRKAAGNQTISDSVYAKAASGGNDGN